MQHKPPARLVMFLKRSAGKKGPRAKKRKRSCGFVCSSEHRPRSTRRRRSPAAEPPLRCPHCRHGVTLGLMDPVRRRPARFTSVHAEKGIEKSASPLKRRECVIPRGDSPTPLTSKHSRKFPDSDTKPCCELPAPRLCVPLRCWEWETGNKAVRAPASAS